MPLNQPLSRRAALMLAVTPVLRSQSVSAFDQAKANSADFERALAASQRVLHAWLRHAGSKTLLLPDRVAERDGRPLPATAKPLYTPHNSGADLYPYLILTAQLTDPDLYHGRMMEMLRNEIRYTTVQESIPANLNLATGELGPPSLFGAGEYAKDGLLSVTEYLGRTPWFYRMADMIADAMNRAPAPSRFGNLPGSDAELNGDYMQALMRLAAMTCESRFLEWARRIADAYIDEVLPGNHGVPSSQWDFTRHTGDGRLRLRDHGNETVVGLVLVYALENARQTPRAARYKAAIGKMLDRILESANPDGMLFNQVDAATLKPLDEQLSDNWGYVYGAVYAFYQCTGGTRYRDAVRKVLGNLPKYRNWVWEGRPSDPPGSFDGYADSIESAIYLVNREPVAGALSWIDSEMNVMLGMQKPGGHLEYWYGEGNFNRTALLWALMKSQGVRPAHWEPGVKVGAVRGGNDTLLLHLEMPSARTIQFDFARHRRVLNLDKNYVRLNEFPEWYTVDENTLYRVKSSTGDAEYLRLGSELIEGIRLTPGDWTVQAGGRAPYANTR